MWQMDAGPLLLPLPGQAAAAARGLSERPIVGLGVGYLVFNRLASEDGGPTTMDAVSRPVAPYPVGAPAAFFSDTFVLDGCVTELWAVIDEDAGGGDHAVSTTSRL